MNHKLRNHIPLGGPATREPFLGNEPDLRVSLGFCPRWFHRRLGIDFSMRWHTDPIYRYGALLKMKTHLAEVFPTVPCFRPNLSNGIEPACATVSGVYGIKLIPMLYGLDVQYIADDWPDNLPGDMLSREKLAALKPFDVAKLPLMEALMGQMDVIEREYGAIHGYLNYQGILNVALKLRGGELFLDMIDDPGFVRHLFAHIADTIGQTARLVQRRQRASGFEIDLLSMSNCVMNMISPAAYRELVLPHDRALSEEFQRFGIHTCNWDVTPYLEALREIPKMGYLDMGMMSDMSRAREMFPDARRAVLYPPVWLERKSPAELRADLTRIWRELAPCDVVMADITDTTEAEKVNAFLQIAGEIESGGGEG